jgi:hypothetical protein
MAKKKDKKEVNLENLCANCAYRFRRVFWTKDLDRYEDVSNITAVPVEEGETANPENQLAIMVICLMSDIDIESDLTMDCSHFRPWTQNEIKSDDSNKLVKDLDNYKRK